MLPALHPQWAPLDFVELLARDAAFVNTDSQNSILHPDGVLTDERIWVDAREQGGCLFNTLRLARACRPFGMPFLWLRYDRFIGEKEPTTPMDRAQYAFWNSSYQGDRARKDWEADLVDEVKALLQPEDLTLVYPGWSIFVATPVARRLAQRGVRTLIVSGYHTDWCVEMAVRSARDLGLMPVVVGDACGSTPAMHEAALAQINDCYAPVVSTDFVLQCLDKAKAAGASARAERVA